jgi:hypothetical protein
MEQTTIKTEAREQAAAPAPREWVTPTFERVPLNEALGSGSPWWERDGTYTGS